MFDDNDPAEAGKLRDGFLTDEQGRRIHVPPFGPRDGSRLLRKKTISAG
jgi:hypothetical protein